MDSRILYIVFMVVGFFALNKGINFWVHYTTIKERAEKIEFMEKNNSPLFDRCITIKSGIDEANMFRDQKALDRFNRNYNSLGCQILYSD